MFLWVSLATLVTAVLAAGPFRTSMPFWIEAPAELIAVVSLFVLVCLLESGGRGGKDDEPAI